MRTDISIGHTSFFHQTSRDNLLCYLNEEEIKRYDRFHFMGDKELHILSRILLRTALKRYQPDVSLQSWQSSTCKRDKPSIVSPQLVKKTFFNPSYTIDTAAAAISSHYELGVDIEQIRNLDNSYLNISQHSFTPQETTNIVSFPHYEGQLLFWKMWTLKEAYTKYRDRGLSLGLDCIEFHLTNKELTSGHRGSPVYFSQRRMCSSFLALASLLAIPKITIELSPMQSQLYHHGYQLIHSLSGRN